MGRMMIPIGGGLYTATDARTVPAGMAQHLNNVVLDRDPARRPVGVRVRPGWKPYATIAGQSSGSINGGVEFRANPVGGTAGTLLYAFGDGTLRQGLTGTVVATHADRAGNRWRFVPLLNPADGNHYVYYTPGHGLFAFNGSFSKELKGAANVYAPAVDAELPEEPNRLADEADQIHLSDILGTAWGSLTLAYKDRVYFSHPLQPDYFPENSYWDVVTDRNDWITVLYGASRGAAIVGKENTLHVLRGTGFDDSTLETVSRTLGIPSSYTVIGVEEAGGVMFQGSDGHVYLYNPGTAEPICLSKAIEGTIKSLQLDSLLWANAWFWDRKYFLRTAHPTGVPHLTLVYDLTTRAWEQHDTYPSGFCAWPYGQQMMLGSINATVVDLDNGTSDNGTAITGTYRTGAVAPAGPSVKHLFQALYITCQGYGTLTVEIAVDGVQRVIKFIDLTTELREVRLSVNAAGHWLDVKISGTEWHVISPLMVEFLVLDVGRGMR